MLDNSAALAALVPNVFVPLHGHDVSGLRNSRNTKIPVTCDWYAGDHPGEDSLYAWGPDLPRDFITNYEADVQVDQVAAELVAAG